MTSLHSFISLFLFTLTCSFLWSNTDVIEQVLLTYLFCPKFWIRFFSLGFAERHTSWSIYCLACLSTGVLTGGYDSASSVSSISDVYFDIGFDSWVLGPFRASCAFRVFSSIRGLCLAICPCFMRCSSILFCWASCTFYAWTFSFKASVRIFSCSSWSFCLCSS